MILPATDFLFATQIGAYSTAAKVRNLPKSICSRQTTVDHMNDHKDFLTQHFPYLIKNVHPKKEPKWGIMTPQHMLEHMQRAFDASTEKVVPQPQLEQAKLDKNKLYFFAADIPFPRHYQYNIKKRKAPKLESLRYRSYESALRNLKRSHSRFMNQIEKDPDALSLHPFLGVLDNQEWIDFHGRHTIHHLRQFSVVEELIE